MLDYLILAEKPSAAANFASALGGRSGTFDGHSYEIVNAFGHLLELDEPENQVSSDKKKKYSSWSPNNMPWNLEDFNWHRVPKISVNPRTKKKGSMEKTIKSIGQKSEHAKSIVIGTDNDPSGEGELLAWEIINAINWHGKVFREFHEDESEHGLQKSMRSLKDVTDQSKDGDYVKSDLRSKWDMASMQLTRLSTTYARDAGYNVRVAPQGRLKSVIVSLVYERLEDIKKYEKKPYFEVKFKDENGNLFTRKISKDMDPANINFRFTDKVLAKQDLTKYKNSAVAINESVIKKSAPTPLLDLSKIDASLSKLGYSSKTVKDVYQALYDNKYLSYPRTEDKFVTREQFIELEKDIDEIADVVGIDKALLTHREPRATHVKANATHGANRPGTKVPKTMDELARVVGSKNVRTCAQDLYKLVAKNALAMFAEDYEYKETKAFISDHSDFVATLKTPVTLNWKAIYGINEDKNNEFSKNAIPMVTEGSNAKPAQPTKDWIFNKLSKFGKHGVGTGATQQSTMADITDDKSGRHLLADNKGKLSLTETGYISALMAKETYISSPDITISLFDGMDRVGKFELDPKIVLASITKVVTHDKPLFEKNVGLLSEVLGQPKPKKKQNEKVEIVWNGKPIKIKSEWSKHKFTTDELQKMGLGESISFKMNGKAYTGSLANQEYKGNKFVGFKPSFSK